MMHQNFQSFGTPWWASGERLRPNVLEGLEDTSSLVDEVVFIAGYFGDCLTRGEIMAGSGQGRLKWGARGERDGYGKEDGQKNVGGNEQRRSYYKQDSGYERRPCIPKSPPSRTKSGTKDPMFLLRAIAQPTAAASLLPTGRG